MKSKFLIFPAVLLTTFIIAYLTLDYFSKKNKQLIHQTRNIYLPGLELSIKLNSKLAKLQHTMQNAVAVGDIHHLEEADTIAEHITNLFSKLEKKSLKPYKITNTSRLFKSYYYNARITSRSMIISDFSEKLSGKLGLMVFQYNEINKQLESLETNNKKLAQHHFTSIEENNKKSSIINLIIILSGFIISVLISHYYSKAIAKPLKLINYELQASQEELKQTNEELAFTNSLLNKKNKDLQLALDKLKQAQLQLIQSEKMASVGLLTAGVAHEINNPLNFIQGGVSGVEEYIEKSINNNFNGLKTFLEIIKTGVSRISNIISSLNRFNRNVDSNSEDCDLHKIIDNCLTMLHSKLKNKVEVIKDYCKEPFIVIGNEGKLHQAFLNILSNAEQAIEKNGMINIESIMENKFIKITISDTGKGIKEENLSRITEPFFTTKAPGIGTGLGLSISQNIISEHEGTIKYNSKQGKGTSVNISIPIKI